ncbi:dUTP diphosphatase-like family protein [[Mycoplasma] cavipharyngis]|uniref:dUTP diphosphatase n=1 Tax=[Mycoplasma] cavipharyngis TaxID=92757 RepID=UPI0037043EE3
MSKIITWDLSPLLIEQSKLDLYIHTKKNTNYQITWHQRLVALFVELNELANETKCFKYWSNNKKIDLTKVLEEYIDSLHFCLSLILYYQLPSQISFQLVEKLDDSQLSEKFLELNLSLQKTTCATTFNSWLQKFLELSYQLGFDQKKVFDKYYEKCQINFSRQDNNY